MKEIPVSARIEIEVSGWSSQGTVQDHRNLWVLIKPLVQAQGGAGSVRWDTHYECEACGYIWDDKAKITTCPVCGAEICEHCCEGTEFLAGGRVCLTCLEGYKDAAYAWKQFCGIPLQNDTIKEPFLQFPAGTAREEVLAWFKECGGPGMGGDD